jgi:hypothetical protein
MKKIIMISVGFIFLAFGTLTGFAGNVVYYAPDGSKITKAQFDRLVAGKTEANPKSKKASLPKPSNKSSRPAPAPRTETAAANSGKTPPGMAKAWPGIQSSAISESDVRKITKEVLQWTNNRRADRLIAYLAPSYKGTLKTDAEIMELTREEYLDYLQEGWSGYGFYRVRKEGENISISPDRQTATLETDIIEIASQTDGTTVKLQSHQKWTYEVVDGKILITHSDAQVQNL